MTDPVRNQAEQDAALEEARHEGFEEGYAEGAADQAGWANDTARAVLQWLDKEGDGFDIHHPDGNTTDAIIQGLYDAKRSGNLTELRQAAARLRSLEGALTDVCKPMAAMRRDAEAKGQKLGDMAYSIAHSLAHVQGIARAALQGEGE